MSYDQKRNVIDYIIKTERELDVCDLSWKHCILFLYLNQTISKEELMKEFTTKEVREKADLEMRRAETYESISYNR